MTMPFAALKLAWGEAKFPLTDKKQKLRPSRGATPWRPPTPPARCGPRPPKTDCCSPSRGRYLVMVQGTLRADTSEDITLKAVVGGDPRFAGPGAVLPGESNLERLLNGLQGDALLTKFPGLSPPGRCGRSPSGAWSPSPRAATCP